MTTKRKTPVTKAVVNAPAKPVAQKLARGATRVAAAIDDAPFQKAKPHTGTQPDTKVFSVDLPEGVDPAAVSAQVEYLLKTNQLFSRFPGSESNDKAKAQPQTTSPINDSIVSIDQELDALHDSIGALAENLEPILAYPEAEAVAVADEGPRAVQASQSPLHNRLIDLRFRLGVATERVRAITGRVRT